MLASSDLTLWASQVGEAAFRILVNPNPKLRYLCVSDKQFRILVRPHSCPTTMHIFRVISGFWGRRILTKNVTWVTLSCLAGLTTSSGVV